MRSLGDLSFVALGKNLGDGMLNEPLLLAGFGLMIVWPRLQTLSGAVPPVDARRIPGRACAGSTFLATASKIAIFGVVMRLFLLRTGG